MSDQAPADWHPDPFGRFEHRWWDGAQWTEHVATRGVQAVDQPVSARPVASAAPVNRQVKRTVEKAGVGDPAVVGGGTLLTESILVVNQKAKLIEVNAEYAVFNQHGQQVGSVREIGQNLVKKAVGVDVFSTRRLQIRDMSGQVLITLTQAATILKASVKVGHPDGTTIGQIVQKNFGILGNIRFNLEAGGKTIGTLSGEGWDTWNFNIQDGDGNEIARITKKWAGFAKEFFTIADNYVVEIHRSLAGPLLYLVVAAALVVDTTLRQAVDDRRANRIF